MTNKLKQNLLERSRLVRVFGKVIPSKLSTKSISYLFRYYNSTQKSDSTPLKETEIDALINVLALGQKLPELRSWNKSTDDAIQMGYLNFLEDFKEKIQEKFLELRFDYYGVKDQLEFYEYYELRDKDLKFVHKKSGLTRREMLELDPDWSPAKTIPVMSTGSDYTRDKLGQTYQWVEPRAPEWDPLKVAPAIWDELKRLWGQDAMFTTAEGKRYNAIPLTEPQRTKELLKLDMYEIIYKHHEDDSRYFDSFRSDKILKGESVYKPTSINTAITKELRKLIKLGDLNNFGSSKKDSEKRILARKRFVYHLFPETVEGLWAHRISGHQHPFGSFENIYQNAAKHSRGWRYSSIYNKTDKKFGLSPLYLEAALNFKNKFIAPHKASGQVRGEEETFFQGLGDITGVKASKKGISNENPIRSEDLLNFFAAAHGWGKFTDMKSDEGKLSVDASSEWRSTKKFKRWTMEIALLAVAIPNFMRIVSAALAGIFLTSFAPPPEHDLEFLRLRKWEKKPASKWTKEQQDFHKYLEKLRLNAMQQTQNDLDAFLTESKKLKSIIYSDEKLNKLFNKLRTVVIKNKALNTSKHEKVKSSIEFFKNTAKIVCHKSQADDQSDVGSLQELFDSLYWISGRAFGDPIGERILTNLFRDQGVQNEIFPELVAFAKRRGFYDDYTSGDWNKNWTWEIYFIKFRTENCLKSE